MRQRSLYHSSTRSASCCVCTASVVSRNHSSRSAPSGSRLLPARCCCESWQLRTGLPPAVESGFPPAPPPAADAVPSGAKSRSSQRRAALGLPPATRTCLDHDTPRHVQAAADCCAGRSARARRRANWERSARPRKSMLNRLELTGPHLAGPANATSRSLLRDTARTRSASRWTCSWTDTGRTPAS